MNTKTYEDRVRGVLFGHAVGDALGLGTEFLSKEEVKHYYPDGLKALDRIIRDDHRKRWLTGEWTDDTAQMLCILDSLLSRGEVDVRDIAGRIYEWHINGGRGIGASTLAVIRQSDFTESPHSAAERFWRESDQEAAPNGGVMRTSVLGIWRNESRDSVRMNAENVCRITHFDPRCVASCVLVCLAIRSLLRGEVDMVTLVDELASTIDGYDPRVRDYIEKGKQQDIEALDLDEDHAIGYTLKAMGAGVWALLHPRSYREGINTIIHEGGDADTNAAVAGAILGAKFGYSGIPGEWVEGLKFKDWLNDCVDQLIRIITPKHP